MQIVLLIFLTFLVFSGQSVDLSCPPGPIDYKTPSGKFPSTGLAQFPKDYGCTIDFVIPNGWVVKFIVQTNAVANSGDQITIRNSVNTLYEFGSGQSVFYAPANNSRVWIETKTDSASFYLQWVFTDVTIYKRNEYPTGTIMKMDLSPLNYYTFTSNTGPVTLHTASKNREYDPNLNTVFVYDGDDLTAPFIGSLLNAVTNSLKAISTKKSLTIVNFYAYTTKYYAVANDYSAISAYASYNFLILSTDKMFLGNGDSRPALTSATTFYCVDCTETYITSLLLVNGNVDGQTANFKPMTPSHGMQTVLSYNAKDDNDNSFPQQILTNTFTMSYSNVDVSLRMQSGPNDDWNKPFAGRKGTIVSPSVWNPTASPAYSTNFTSGTTYSFSFVLKSTIISMPGEMFRVEVGSLDRARPAVLQYTQTVKNAGTRLANGTYMATSFTGTTPASSFTMTFAINDISAPSPTGSSTTPASVQTTTKSATQVIDLTCPTAPITISTPNGSFPNTGGIMVPFPANYTCSIQFNIPLGYVVKFNVETTAFGGPGDDSIIIYDSATLGHDLNLGQTTFYAPANTSTVKIITFTDTSAFAFTWEYQDVSHFGQFQDSTGYAMQMQLLPKYYYLFTSIRGPITFHTANINHMRDVSLASIYVYDGSDLTAPYIGNLLTLSDLPSWKTSGKALVLVNYYNDTSISYGISNDYDAISGFALYNFWLLTTAQAGSIQLGAQAGSSVAATYYCVDSTETYITSMSVSQNGISPSQSAIFQPMSPTLSQEALLGFTPSQEYSSYMPQQIPGRMFTMVSTSVTVSASFVSGPFADWFKATPGRKGIIFSPSVWDPISPAAYSTNFTSSNMVTFNFNLDNVVVAAAGEKIDIVVGSPNSNPLVTEFSKTSTNVGSRSANGTYMSTVYTGKSNKSMFVLQFDIATANPSPNPSTTSRPIVTTTSPSAQTFNLKLALLVLTLFKVFMN